MVYNACAFLFLLTIVLLCVGLACVLAGQHCTISIQQRRPNHELTRRQQEEEEKQEKKFSSKVKRVFGSSSKTEQPPAPVEDIKTVELTFKLGNDDKPVEQVMTVNEPSTILLPKPISSASEREARQKRREEIKRKYNL